jgi:hypothetical protein
MLLFCCLVLVCIFIQKSEKKYKPFICKSIQLSALIIFFLEKSSDQTLKAVLLKYKM